MYTTNGATIIGRCITRLPLQVGDAFRLAWPEARKHFEKGADWVIAWVHGESKHVETRRTSARSGLPQDLIFGRHDHCSLMADRDPTVSLRHVLVRTYTNKDGEPRVRFLDLQTPNGFFHEGETCQSVLGSGDLFISVGGYWLLAIARVEERSCNPAKAWSERPQRLAVETTRLGVEQHDGAMTLSNPLPVGRVGTSYSKLPPARLLATAPDFHAAARSDVADLECLGTLTIPRMSVQLAVGVNALASGILVGRYDRCAAQTSIDGESLLRLSRVHLCLLLDESGLWAIDTASTNGSSVDGQPFESLWIEDVVTIDVPEMQMHWRRT